MTLVFQLNNTEILISSWIVFFYGLVIDIAVS